jgi:tetratricopeptide (TPR) repeat protein
VLTWLVVGGIALAARGVSRRALGIWAVSGASLLFAGSLAWDAIVARAQSVDSIEKLQATKIELWPMFAKSAGAFWRTGMGLGAFELGFPKFQTNGMDATYTHPENLIFQWINEAGVPLTLLFGYLLFRGLKRVWQTVSATTLERTAVIGAVSVALHDLFDFSLELNGIIVSVVVVLGLAAGIARESSARTGVTREGLIGAAAVMLFGVIAVSRGVPEHLVAQEKMLNAVRGKSGWENVRELGLASIDRHPASWMLYGNLATQAAFRAGPDESLAWTNRWLFLRPSDAQAHVAAATALTRLGRPAQALLEYRTAWELGDQASYEAGLALALKGNVLNEVLIEKPKHLASMYRLLRQRKLIPDSLRLIDVASGEDSNDVARADAQVLRVIHEAEVGDALSALELLSGLTPAASSTMEMSLIKAQLLYRTDHKDESIQTLKKLSVQEPSNLWVARLLSDQLAAAGRPAAAREVLARARPFAVVPSDRSDLFQREARLFLTEGRPPRALDLFQTAARIEPRRADLRYRTAEVYERMGILHGAIEEVRRGKALDTPQGAAAVEPWLVRLEAAERSQIQ